jgi:hypothetical protein
MNEMMVSICDARRAVHGQLRPSLADAVVASLAADPETVEELEAAVVRWIDPVPLDGLFAGWSVGIDDGPCDVGNLFIDLASRTVASRLRSLLPAERGRAAYHDGMMPTDAWLSYALADDWQLMEASGEWRDLVEQRRAARAAATPLDARSVLYETVLEFLVAECARAATAGEPSARDIHIRWLTTPRSDLRGQSPRDVLATGRSFVETQLEHQQQYWARLGHCPPGLDRRSAAYRFGGFGIHEFIMYYDLVRYLLEECWQRTAGRAAIDVAKEVDHLGKLKQEWLHTPLIDLDGHSPAQIIDRERARLPMVSSAADLIDDDACDCPLCQLMAEDDAPVFWCLDGCHMDDDFAFSLFYDTREGWEADHRAAAACHTDQGPTATPPPGAARGSAEFDSVWQSSYLDRRLIDELPTGEALEVNLFAVGARIAELGTDLTGTAVTDRHATAIRTDFTRLRQAIGSHWWWSVGDAIAEFAGDLQEIAAVRPDLTAKCIDLTTQLDGMARRCHEVGWAGEA